jgi:hypothetical protein
MPAIVCRLLIRASRNTSKETLDAHHRSGFAQGRRRRNDQQDALGRGLAVTEYANEGKSADEIRGLWQWVWSRLTSLSPQEAQAEVQAAAWPANEQTELRAAG